MGQISATSLPNVKSTSIVHSGTCDSDDGKILGLESDSDSDGENEISAEHNIIVN